jgi:hypothetical protein
VYWAIQYHQISIAHLAIITLNHQWVLSNTWLPHRIAYLAIKERHITIAYSAIKEHKIVSNYLATKECQMVSNHLAMLGMSCWHHQAKQGDTC